MLKKLAIGSAALLLSCILLVAMLAPVAIDQTVRMAESLSGQYEKLELCNTIPAQGVKTVDIFRGLWMEELTLRPSPDENIYFYTEQFWVNGSEMTYDLDEETGHMSLRSYWYGAGRNPWKMLTRENILRQIVLVFSGRQGMRAELWLPEGVAFNQNSRVDKLKNPDGLVKVYTQIPDWDRVDPPTEDEGLTDPEETPDREEQQLQEKLQQAKTLQEYNRWMAQRYDQYEEGKLTEEAFFANLQETLGKTAEILVAYDDSEEISVQEMEGYLLWTVEKNQMLLDRRALYRSYENRAMTKEAFYDRDLKLDRVEEDLEKRRSAEEFTLFQAVLTAESALGVETDFGRILYGEGL